MVAGRRAGGGRNNKECKCRVQGGSPENSTFQIFLSICSSVTTRVTRRCNVIGPPRVTPPTTLFSLSPRTRHYIPFSVANKRDPATVIERPKFKERLNHSVKLLVEKKIPIAPTGIIIPISV